MVAPKSQRTYGKNCVQSWVQISEMKEEGEFRNGLDRVVGQNWMDGFPKRMVRSPRFKGNQENEPHLDLMKYQNSR